MLKSIASSNGRDYYYVYEDGRFERKLFNSVVTAPTKYNLSYSQVGQDYFVADIMGNKKNGFFLDLASNHFKFLSNTYALEMDLDWEGLCIEANPKYHADYVNRKCTLLGNAISDRSGKIMKFTFRDSLGGLVHEEKFANHNNINMSAYDVVTVSLDDALENLKVPKVIDYLSLDVEGAELFIMKYFNFTKYKINVMTIERPDEELHRLVTQNGYKFLTALGIFGESLYVSTSHPRYAEILQKYNEKQYYFRVYNGKIPLCKHKVNCGTKDVRFGKNYWQEYQKE